MIYRAASHMSSVLKSQQQKEFVQLMHVMLLFVPSRLVICRGVEPARFLSELYFCTAENESPT